MYDVERALRDGVSEKEIARYLAKTRNFDIKGSLRDGYSHKEIIDYLAPQKSAVPKSIPQEITPKQVIEKPSISPIQERPPVAITPPGLINPNLMIPEARTQAKPSPVTPEIAPGLPSQPKVDTLGFPKELIPSHEPVRPTIKQSIAEPPKDFGLRPDRTPKGPGFLGTLQRPEGGVSTEISVGVNINGQEVEIPSLVPTLDQAERDYLLSTPLSPEMWKTPMGQQVMAKAIEHAKRRMAQGKSPFAQKGEQVAPKAPEKKPSAIAQAGETLKNLATVYGPVEAAANLASQIYGLPPVGLAQLAGLPFGKSQEFGEFASKAIVYEPRTEAGRQLAEATSYPFKLLDIAGEKAAEVTREKTGSPMAATAVGTAVKAAPLALGLRGPLKSLVKSATDSAWYRNLTIKERGLVTQSLDDMLNKGYSEADVLKRWNNPSWREEALRRRNKGEEFPPFAEAGKTAEPTGPRVTPPGMAPTPEPIGSMIPAPGTPAVRPTIEIEGESQLALPPGQGFQLRGPKPKAISKPEPPAEMPELIGTTMPMGFPIAPQPKPTETPTPTTPIPPMMGQAAPAPLPEERPPTFAEAVTESDARTGGAREIAAELAQPKEAATAPEVTPEVTAQPIAEAPPIEKPAILPLPEPQIEPQGAEIPIQGIPMQMREMPTGTPVMVNGREGKINKANPDGTISVGFKDGGMADVRPEEITLIEPLAKQEVLKEALPTSKKGVKTSEEAQRAIDDKMDDLQAKGMSFEDASKDPEVEKLFKVRDDIDQKDLAKWREAVIKDTGLPETEAKKALATLIPEGKTGVYFTAQTLKDWGTQTETNLAKLYNHFAGGKADQTVATFRWGGTADEPILQGSLIGGREFGWNEEALKKTEKVFNAIAKTQSLPPIDLSRISGEIPSGLTSKALPISEEGAEKPALSPEEKGTPATGITGEPVLESMEDIYGEIEAIKNTPDINKTKQAHDLGKTLTKDQVKDVWEKYKERIKGPRPEKVSKEEGQKWLDRSFTDQMYRETVAGYLGEDKMSHAFTPREIEKRLSEEVMAGERRPLEEFLPKNKRPMIKGKNIPGTVGFDIGQWLNEHGKILTKRNPKTGKLESPGLDMTALSRREGANKAWGKYTPFAKAGSGKGYTFDVLFQELQAEGYTGTIDDALQQLQARLTEGRPRPTDFADFRRSIIEGDPELLRGETINDLTGSLDDEIMGWKEEIREQGISEKDIGRAVEEATRTYQGEGRPPDLETIKKSLTESETTPVVKEPPTETVGEPTSQLAPQLKDLGYDDRQIARMRPDVAKEIVNKGLNADQVSITQDGYLAYITGKNESIPKEPKPIEETILSPRTGMETEISTELSAPILSPQEVTPPGKVPISTQMRETSKVELATGDWSKGESRPFAFDPNSTENEGRFRLYPPEEIEKGTYKSQTSIKSKGIETTEGVRFLLGNTKDGQRIIQTIRFDKLIMPEEKARQWWTENAEKFGRKVLEKSPEPKSLSPEIETKIRETYVHPEEVQVRAITTKDLAPEFKLSASTTVKELKDLKNLRIERYYGTEIVRGEGKHPWMDMDKTYTYDAKTGEELGDYAIDKIRQRAEAEKQYKERLREIEKLPDVEGKKIEPTTKINVKTPKEQKKYLIDAIDEAIKRAPEEYVKPVTINIRGGVKPIIEKTPHVIIEVPGDGTFRVINSKQTLEGFKKAAESRFPGTPEKLGTEKTRVVSEKPSGRRISPRENAAYEYITEYSPKRVNEADYAVEKTAMVGEGWFTNGQYAVKGDPPAIFGKKVEKKPLTKEKIAKVTPSLKDMSKATHVVEFHIMDTSGNEGIAISKKEYAYFDPALMDVVRKHLPDAELYIKDSESPMAFVKDKEVVGILMPMRGHNPATLNLISDYFEGEKIKTPWEKEGPRIEVSAPTEATVPPPEAKAGIPETKTEGAIEEVAPELQLSAKGKEGKNEEGKLVDNAISEVRVSNPLTEGKEKGGEGVKISDFGKKIGGARKDIAERGYTMTKTLKTEETGPAWKKRFVAIEKVKEPGQWIIHDTKAGDFQTRTGQVFSSQEEAEKAIPIYAVARQHSVYQNRDDTWSILKKVSDRKRLKVINQDFPSREDAMKYMATHAEDILNVKTTFGEEILPTPEKVSRKGVERRTKDATSDMFMEAFAPRGIEFGNWNNQEERQQVMNHAYDALLDLADALNLPPKALMLNGELAIAFGARGQGLTGAKAHYERDYGVINLTKMKGAGSLAHEWLHAFDHYLGRLDTKAKVEKIKNELGNLVYPTRTVAQDYLSHGLSYKSQLRPELKEAYQNLIDTMYKKAERYVEDTKKADEFLGKARENLRTKLNEIRQNLSRDFAKEFTWRKSKKGLAPASAEQLDEFDQLANTLLEGGSLDTEFRYNTPGQPEGGKPKGMSRSTFGKLMAGRRSNDTLDGISAIYKAVRNRTGFADKYQGQLDSVSAAMTTYKERLKMLGDAQMGTEKTKKVPTSYAIEAKKMDQARRGNYWSEPHEMVARAFASYVEDKIAEHGGQSDFLVYQAKGGILLPMIDGFIARPYPEGPEREAINEAFDKFIKALKTNGEGGRYLYGIIPFAFPFLMGSEEKKKENYVPIETPSYLPPGMGR